MNTTTKILCAVTASEAEGAFFQRAVTWLNAGRAGGPFELRIQTGLPREGFREPAWALFLSPLTLLAAYSSSALATLWNSFRDVAVLPPFLCTVFRHVPDRRTDGAALLDRIRRCNLALVEASRETGAFVVDIDRAFAAVGARSLETDYRLRGPRARELAADAVVQTLKRAAPDEVQLEREGATESTPTP